MKNQILLELKELRSALSKILGTSNLPEEQQFSIASIDKAADEFKKIQINRGEWVQDTEIQKYVKNSGWCSGNFIRTEFRFSNYFKKGKKYYYNKNDLIVLSKELKDRNINLGRYIEFKTSEGAFKRKVSEAATNRKLSKKKKPYTLPDKLRDMSASEPPFPSVDLVRQDIKNLETEFFKSDLVLYIDIYQGSYAMMKNDYTFLKYRNKDLGSKCRKWCENFNYANNALEVLTRKRKDFIPLKEEEMLEL